ncbi:MAG: DNA-3-methyladenine glycosylase [Cyanobacteria bacterium J06639_14]
MPVHSSGSQVRFMEPDSATVLTPSSDPGQAASSATTRPYLDAAWLNRPATAIAPALIGCTLIRRFPDGTQYRGLIVETEAYEPGDPACHAYRRRTQRNAAMFGPAGTCYVYLIYGMYHCINVVTDAEDVPCAVLIRALQLDAMPPWLETKQQQKPQRIAAGPGKLCRTLQIDLSLNGIRLTPEHPLWLEPRSMALQQDVESGRTRIVQTTRIGLTQGTDRPWRWYVENHPAVSKKG